MAANTDMLKRDTGRPCLACGNYTYVEATVNESHAAVYLERKGRTTAEKFKGKGKCSYSVRVCRKCGFVAAYAEDLASLLNDPTLGGDPTKI